MLIFFQVGRKMDFLWKRNRLIKKNLNFDEKTLFIGIKKERVYEYLKTRHVWLLIVMSPTILY